MKHLVIRNIGPLKEVDIALSKINLIIGPQSTGKSCILKIASFCAWLEKTISLNQDKREFLSREAIDKKLIAFHNLQGYVDNSSFFEYETEVMKFSFSFKDNKSTFEWNKGRWEYKRSKISYIVAERNILSVIPNWFEINFPNNSLRYFLKEWHNARTNKASEEQLMVLNTGVGYKYDKDRSVDNIILNNGNELSLLNASSGLQSLVPLFVFMDYITNDIFGLDIKSIKDQDAKMNLLYQLKDNHPSGGNIQIRSNYDFSYDSKTIINIVDNFTNYNYSDIYLEEPEENLFPETQRDLVNWLAEILNGERNHTLFIATHSPYIMSAFNNLIQAGDIIEESPEKKTEVEKIIGGNRAIKYDDVAAFAIANGSVHSIKDDELRLMSPSELDTVSDDISNVFNQLLEL